MSNWAYVAIAYTVVWGALALYALLLVRRVAQAREVERHLNQAQQSELRGPESEQESVACDVPPAP